MYKVGFKMTNHKQFY